MILGFCSIRRILFDKIDQRKTVLQANLVVALATSHGRGGNRPRRGRDEGIGQG